MVIDRTVLEWRVDPASGSRHPAIASLEVPLILLYAQGYSSSLAVASLLDLGARDVSDVIGGFEAWRQQARRSVLSAPGRQTKGPTAPQGSCSRAGPGWH